MRRNIVLPAVVALLVVFAAAAGFLSSRVTSGPGGGSVLEMTERWLREDARSNVEVYAGAVPPALDQLLNSGVTNPADRVSLPIHPQAKLLGSSYMHQPDGTDLVWMMYDVDGDIGTVAQTIAGQLDTSPWQVTAGLGEDTTRVVRFQNSRIADLEGSAIVRLNPNADGYRLTVARSGQDTTLDVKLTALTPSIGARIQPDLTVGRVDPGSGRAAGLLTGDRIVRVNDTGVKNPQELAAALQAVANAGSPRAAVTYIVALGAQEDAGSVPRAFVPPQKPLALPQTFPGVQAWQGLTVLRYAWGAEQGGKAYQASMVSRDSASAVAGRVRDGLKAAGWQITGDAPRGFATELQVASSAAGLSGQVSIDQFAEDSAYIQVVVQLQSGQASGRP